MAKRETDEPEVVLPQAVNSPIAVNPELEKMKAENEKLKKKLAKATETKGIPSVIKKDGTIKRPDEAMAENLPDAIAKTNPDELTVAEKIALEREIRKYVTRSYGFKPGLSESDLERAKMLLAKVGRNEPKWDVNIDVPGFWLKG